MFGLNVKHQSSPGSPKSPLRVDPELGTPRNTSTGAPQKTEVSDTESSWSDLFNSITRFCQSVIQGCYSYVNEELSTEFTDTDHVSYPSPYIIQVENSQWEKYSQRYKAGDPPKAFSKGSVLNTHVNTDSESTASDNSRSSTPSNTSPKTTPSLRDSLDIQPVKSLHIEAHVDRQQEPTNIPQSLPTSSTSSPCHSDKKHRCCGAISEGIFSDIFVGTAGGVAAGGALSIFDMGTTATVGGLFGGISAGTSAATTEAFAAATEAFASDTESLPEATEDRVDTRTEQEESSLWEQFKNAITECLYRDKTRPPTEPTRI